MKRLRTLLEKFPPDAHVAIYEGRVLGAEIDEDGVVVLDTDHGGY